MAISRLPRLDALPDHATPREFENHMDPEILWTSPEAYVKEFSKLAAAAGEPSRSRPMEAAFTQSTGSWPAFVNARVVDGKIVLTVRPEGTEAEPNPNPVSIAMEEADFHQFIADAQRLQVPPG